MWRRQDAPNYRFCPACSHPWTGRQTVVPRGIRVHLLGGLRAPRGCDLCAGNPPRGYSAGSGMTRRATKGKAVITGTTALESTGAAEESRTPASSLGGRRATATPRPHQFGAPPLSSAAGAPAAHEHLLGKNIRRLPSSDQQTHSTSKGSVCWCNVKDALRRTRDNVRPLVILRTRESRACFLAPLKVSAPFAYCTLR